MDQLRREVPATSLVVAVDPGKAFERVWWLMPLLTAGMAWSSGTSLISLLPHAMGRRQRLDRPCRRIGLGIGVHYGLFIISRHRSAAKAGLSYQDAAAQAASTPRDAPSFSPA